MEGGVAAFGNTGWLRSLLFLTVSLLLNDSVFDRIGHKKMEIADGIKIECELKKR